MGSQYSQEDINALIAQNDAEEARMIKARAAFSSMMRWSWLWAPIVLLKYYWGEWRRRRMVKAKGANIFVFTLSGVSVECITVPKTAAGMHRFFRKYRRDTHFLVSDTPGVVALMEEGSVVVHVHGG